MEVNYLLNRLLLEDSEGRCRALRLRTYAVVCLDEECGILEWVNNTKALRLCIVESYSLAAQVMPNLKEIVVPFNEMQKTCQDNLENLVIAYRNMVTNHSKPQLHRWFLSHFQDATKWLEARERFTRSVAVWSAVGHIVGLGDRHSENILIDTVNGEAVFVDFDCLFDKGLSLSGLSEQLLLYELIAGVIYNFIVPEIVPFRLTPNMVDAMGILEVEGIFRRALEVTLSVLRSNKDSLLSILEPFLYDPTVAWNRKGRAQKFDAGTGVKMAGKEDANSADAREILHKISDRLKGVYNIRHPKLDLISRGYEDRKQPLPVKGLGAHRGEDFPLSVQGQAQRLIEEAVAEENLAQMYVGWQPWL